MAAALAALLTAVAIVACGAADEPPHVACRALGEPADRAPGAGRLAVASDPDGSFEFDGDQSDLYLLNADGSGRRRLTTARGNDFTPAWSPDGTQIAFRSNRDREHALDPNDELYVICADGSHERRLTTTPDIQERSPAFSPDGRWLAFAGENRDHVLDLYLMRPDGTQRRNLTADLDCGAEYPGWSPGGTRIAFHCFAALDDLEIYTIAADGTHPQRITRAAGEDSFPAWSPDGRAILFSRGIGDLYLIRPDGTRRMRLTRHPRIEAFPSWSPDGSQIAFASDRGRREQSYQIYVMRSDGSAVRQITRGRASHFNPAWQPVRAAR